ncbi:MAG: hypothetical protein HQ516_03020 [Chlorobium sp.]|nr:hypothetical protein [Chlorobium phaeovibrioides]NQU46002.1 hypothetical protein [Chlorobium sp.]
MTIKNTLSRAIIGASLLTAGLTPANASAVVAAGQSASGTTTMTVTMPEYIVLRYYSSIALNFTASSSTTGGASEAMSIKWTVDEGDTTLAANIADPTELGVSPRKIKLQNVWAIAGLSPSGTATVKIEGTDLTKQNGNEQSTIGVTDWTVASGKTTGEEITTNLRGIAGGVTKGDVNMTMDFAKTSMSGDHKGSFTITVQTI